MKKTKNESSRMMSYHIPLHWKDVQNELLNKCVFKVVFTGNFL